MSERGATLSDLVADPEKYHAKGYVGQRGILKF